MQSNEKPTHSQLERMNKGALKTLAIDAGVSVDENWTKDELVERLVAAGATADNADSAQTEERVADTGVRFERTSNAGLSGKKAKVMIPATDAPGGDKAVDVSVNGRLARIPRDKWCEIGVEYIEVLEHAIAGTLEQKGVDDDGRPIWVPRDSRRFAFQTRESTSAA